MLFVDGVSNKHFSYLFVMFHVERKNQAQRDCNGSSNNCELFVLRKKRVFFLLIEVDG